jgi:hypothetical protein
VQPAGFTMGLFNPQRHAPQLVLTRHHLESSLLR